MVWQGPLSCTWPCGGWPCPISWCDGGCCCGQRFRSVYFWHMAHPRGLSPVCCLVELVAWLTSLARLFWLMKRYSRDVLILPWQPGGESSLYQNHFKMEGKGSKAHKQPWRMWERSVNSDLDFILLIGIVLCRRKSLPVILAMLTSPLRILQRWTENCFWCLNMRSR